MRQGGREGNIRRERGVGERDLVDISKTSNENVNILSLTHFDSWVKQEIKWVLQKEN